MYSLAISAIPDLQTNIMKIKKGVRYIKSGKKLLKREKKKTDNDRKRDGQEIDNVPLSGDEVVGHPAVEGEDGGGGSNLGSHVANGSHS